VRARSGTEPGQAGQNLVTESGDGGSGGYAFLIPNGGGGTGSSETKGQAGIPGSIYAAAGNGGPGGNGGTTQATIGAYGAGTDRAEKAILHLVNGGNGGTSTNPGMPGGAGGTVTMYGLPAPKDPTITINNYGNGGDGYNGCQPIPVAGTAGGNGGNLSPSSGITYAPVLSFTGGDGGDGQPPAAKGLGGTDARTGAKFSDGFAGVICEYSKKAVQLLFHLRVGDVIVFPAGAIVPIKQLTGYRVYGPDTGCTQEHLHAAGPGIFFQGQGPFEDENPTGCGYGHTLTLP
jgi:hypothetical protein